MRLIVGFYYHMSVLLPEIKAQASFLFMDQGLC